MHSAIPENNHSQLFVQSVLPDVVLVVSDVCGNELPSISMLVPSQISIQHSGAKCSVQSDGGYDTICADSVPTEVVLQYEAQFGSTKLSAALSMSVIAGDRPAKFVHPDFEVRQIAGEQQKEVSYIH